MVTDSNIGSYDYVLSKNTFYKARVRGYIQLESKKVYGAWSPYRYFASMPDTKFTKEKNAKIGVSWKKVSGASQYIVLVGRKADGSDAVKTATVSSKKTSYAVTKMGKDPIEKNGKEYYVFLRPCIKIKKKQKSGDIIASSDSIIFYQFDE